MSCNTSLTSILKGCENNIGTIQKYYLAPDEFVTGMTYSAGTITAINMSGSTGFVEYQFNKNSASYTEEGGIDLTAGSTIYTTTVNLTIPRREVEKRNSIALVSAGQRNLKAIILDGNGKYWLQGYEFSTNLTALGGGAGATKAEGSNYTLGFTSEETQQMPEIDPTIISSLIV